MDGSQLRTNGASRGPEDVAPVRRRGRPLGKLVEQRRQQALDAARREFVRNGYRATDLEAVAAVAGVTKQTLYAWHGSKAGLFLACVQEGSEHFKAPVIDPDAPVEAALLAYAIDLAREISTELNFGMTTLLLRDGPDFPEFAQAQRAAEQSLVATLADFLRQKGLGAACAAQRAKLFITMILSPVHASLILRAPPPGPEEIEQNARLAVEIFLRGAGAGQT